MALIYRDRVAETADAPAAGLAFALAGAIGGFAAFAAAIGVGNTCVYMAEGTDGAGALTGNWESGIGRVTASATLERIHVIDSSSGAGVDFSADAATRVFVTIPAGFLLGQADTTSNSMTRYGDLADAVWMTSPHQRGLNSAAFIDRLRAHFVAFPISRPARMTHLRFECTQSFAAGTTAKLGLYRADGDHFRPGTLAQALGAVAIDTAAVKEVDLTPGVILVPGLHYIALATMDSGGQLRMSEGSARSDVETMNWLGATAGSMNFIPRNHFKGAQLGPPGTDPALAPTASVTAMDDGPVIQIMLEDV